MAVHKVRVLVGKPGLDGHDRGAKVVAAALRDAGMEVVYTGLHQTPEQIVEAALQEDVDVVALSVLSGAHMTLAPETLALMRRRGIGDRLLTGGGIIPGEDMATLLERGVGRLFGPGTNTHAIIDYIREWYAGVHGRAAMPVMESRRASSTPPATSTSRPAPPARAAAAGSAAPAKSARRAVAVRNTPVAPPATRARATKAARPARANTSASGSS